MASIRCHALSATVLLVLLSFTRADVTDSVKDSVNSYVDGDPIEFLKSLANMPPEEQASFLQFAGVMLQDQAGLDCNIFAGEAACKDIEAGSVYEATCAKHGRGLSVDCAYYSASERDLTIDPKQQLGDYLGPWKQSQLEKFCPQCFTNLQSLWCAQALPKCGSFGKHVQTALLPAVLAANEMQEEGQPQNVAVSAAVPMIIQAMSKTMACQEMCTAVMRTCSCDSSATRTFGSALTAIQQTDEFKGMPITATGPEFTQLIFKDVWDTPICDLFTPSSDPDFSGTCDKGVIDSTCTHPNKFCADMPEADQQFTEAAVAMEMARGIFAFVDGPAGLLAQNQAFSMKVKSAVAFMEDSDIEEQRDQAFEPYENEEYMDTPEGAAAAAAVEEYIAPSAATWEAERGVRVAPSVAGKHHKRHHWGLLGVFSVLLFLALGSFAATIGWKKYREYKAQQSYTSYDLINEGF